jgi:hypothetical protein
MGTLTELALRIEAAASLFERTIALLEERESARTGDVEKIVAAIETNQPNSRESDLQHKLEAAEQQIAELKAQLEARLEAQALKQEAPAAAAASVRRTVPAATAQLLAKQGITTLEHVEAGALDAALTGLSLEQRIAVKAQLLRAGIAG